MDTASEYLQTSLGGNMNLSTLKYLAFIEIMEDYAKYYHFCKVSQINAK